MADASNFYTGPLSGVKGESKFMLVMYWLSMAFILALLAFESIRKGGSTGIAAFAVSTVFVLPLLISYVLTQGQIFNSPASEDTLAASNILPFVGYLLIGGGSLVKLSFFSVATNSYLSLLSSLSINKKNLVNLEMATGIETYFLPAIGAVLYPFSRKGLRAVGVDSKAAAVALSALPPSIGFAVLHGVRSPLFLVFAGSVMFAWIFSLGYEDVSSNAVFTDWFPVSMLTLIGLHRANNFISSGTSLYDFYTGLLGASGVVQAIGVIVVVRDAILVIGTAFWLYRVVFRNGAAILEETVAGIAEAVGDLV
jgi:hypothetical protein